MHVSAASWAAYGWDFTPLTHCSWERCSALPSHTHPCCFPTGHVSCLPAVWFLAAGGGLPPSPHTKPGAAAPLHGALLPPRPHVFTLGCHGGQALAWQLLAQHGATCRRCRYAFPCRTGIVSLGCYHLPSLPLAMHSQVLEAKAAGDEPPPVEEAVEQARGPEFPHCLAPVVFVGTCQTSRNGWVEWECPPACFSHAPDGPLAHSHRTRRCRIGERRRRRWRRWRPPSMWVAGLLPAARCRQRSTATVLAMWQERVPTRRRSGLTPTDLPAAKCCPHGCADPILSAGGVRAGQRRQPRQGHQAQGGGAPSG